MKKEKLGEDWGEYQSIRKSLKAVKYHIRQAKKKGHVTNWRKRKKEKLVNYKGGKCEICGYDKCLSALDFHHKNPKEKDFGIASSSKSFERQKKEADKCMLVCRNCHAEIHEELQNEDLRNKKAYDTLLRREKVLEERMKQFKK